MTADYAHGLYLDRGARGVEDDETTEPEGDDVEAAWGRVSAAIQTGALRVNASVPGPRDPITEAMDRIAGVATLAGMTREVWAEARLCDCTDATHPELAPLDAERCFYWTPDVAQVDASRVFYPGPPHVVTRRRLVITGPTEDQP